MNICRWEYLHNRSRSRYRNRFRFGIRENGTGVDKSDADIDADVRYFARCAWQAKARLLGVVDYSGFLIKIRGHHGLVAAGWANGGTWLGVEVQRRSWEAPISVLYGEAQKLG
jgi:hypothetical protein